MKDIRTRWFTIHVLEKGEKIYVDRRTIELYLRDIYIKPDGAKGLDKDEPSLAFIGGVGAEKDTANMFPTVIVQVSAATLAPVFEELKKLGAL